MNVIQQIFHQPLKILFILCNIFYNLLFTYIITKQIFLFDPRSEMNCLNRNILSLHLLNSILKIKWISVEIFSFSKRYFCIFCTFFYEPASLQHLSRKMRMYWFHFAYVIINFMKLTLRKKNCS